jgi:hypothetical protein
VSAILRETLVEHPSPPRPVSSFSAFRILIGERRGDVELRAAVAGLVLPVAAALLLISIPRVALVVLLLVLGLPLEALFVASGVLSVRHAKMLRVALSDGVLDRVTVVSLDDRSSWSLRPGWVTSGTWQRGCGSPIRFASKETWARSLEAGSEVAILVNPCGPEVLWVIGPVNDGEIGPT